jgi:hypothetical protein
MLYPPKYIKNHVARHMSYKYDFTTVAAVAGWVDVWIAGWVDVWVAEWVDGWVYKS